MWILLQIIGAACIAFSQAAGKVYGFTLKPYFIYVGLAIFITGWIFPLGFSIAPSFLQAYFVQVGSIAVIGFLASMMYFQEFLPWWNYIGGAVWKNEGMRIDYVLCSKPLTSRIKDVEVDIWPRRRRTPKPSDHAPLIVEFTEI